jgi:hypothetical protein
VIEGCSELKMMMVRNDLTSVGDFCHSVGATALNRQRYRDEIVDIETKWV